MLLGTSAAGIKWPGVGECPVPFVLATCLKTSPSRYSRLLFPCAYVFTKRKRMRGWRNGEDVRSFDSTAFLPIRQTFDSFTWEPRNSSWWLSTWPSLFSPSFLFPLTFGCQVHVSRLSMPLDMFLTYGISLLRISNVADASYIWQYYPSRVDFAIAANILCRCSSKALRCLTVTITLRMTSTIMFLFSWLFTWQECT